MCSYTLITYGAHPKELRVATQKMFKVRPAGHATPTKSKLGLFHPPHVPNTLTQQNRGVLRGENMAALRPGSHVMGNAVLFLLQEEGGTPQLDGGSRRTESSPHVGARGTGGSH